MNIIFRIALFIGIVHAFFLLEKLFSMEEKKEITKLIRSKSCPELAVLKYKKKVRINKEKELWISISFLGQRIDALAKDQRGIGYMMQKFDRTLATIFDQNKVIDEELIKTQERLNQLQRNVEILLHDKRKRLQLKTLKKRKEIVKDDSNGTSSLVDQLPPPEEDPITKDRPKEHFLI